MDMKHFSLFILIIAFLALLFGIVLSKADLSVNYNKENNIEKNTEQFTFQLSPKN